VVCVDVDDVDDVEGRFTIFARTRRCEQGSRMINDSK